MKIISVLVLFLFSVTIFAEQLLYVIDGDTIKIMYNGEKTSVRLLGIDTPETRKIKRAYKQAERHDVDVEAIVKGRKLNST